MREHHSVPELLNKLREHQFCGTNFSTPGAFWVVNMGTFLSLAVLEECGAETELGRSHESNCSSTDVETIGFGVPPAMDSIFC